MWKFTGNQRPSFAQKPTESQESVWDYPRPPACVDDPRQVIVRCGELELARSQRAVRVLETASPPTVYIPRSDVNLELLTATSNQSFCEWKGAATYWTLQHGETVIRNCGWSYDDPSPAFEKIRGYLSFYPALLECWVGEERAQPQGGGFYGGWVTPEIVGPWKGEAGTGGW